MSSLKRGDGAHVRTAFVEGKKRGLFEDGDSVVVIHTVRRLDGVKQWMMRLLTVSAEDLVLTTDQRNRRISGDM